MPTAGSVDAAVGETQVTHSLLGEAEAASLVIVCCGHWRRVIDIIHGLNRSWLRAEFMKSRSVVSAVSREVQEICRRRLCREAPGHSVVPPYVASTFLTAPIQKVVYERCEGSHVSACVACAFL